MNDKLIFFINKIFLSFDTIYIFCFYLYVNYIYLFINVILDFPAILSYIFAHILFYLFFIVAFLNMNWKK